MAKRELGFNWGILGTGRVAQDFAYALRHCDEAHLIAVASRDSERARAFAARTAADQAFDSFAKLLNVRELDIVYIATPNHRHKDDCLEALAAGKSVLCEKPLALNAADARIIGEAAQKARLFCMEGMWTHFIPAVLEADRLLKEGAIGEPNFISGSFGVPTVFHEENRFFNSALGGGALLDRGCYPISLALRLFGTVESVSGECVFGPTGVDTTTAGVIRFSGGRLAVIEASLTAYQANNLIVSGTKGRLILHESITRPRMLSLNLCNPIDTSPTPPDVGNAKTILRDLVAKRSAFVLMAFIARILPRHIGYESNGYVHEIEEVHRCLRGGIPESPVIPLARSIATLEVIDAIKDCSRKAQSPSGSRKPKPS
jgi:predicted dehydrogenase